ncbi:hypothetical protein K239x_06520 [Planctomycetes bacterium K23_9]|uniref:Polysaccharide biosynthesis protein n=1 Tax=Stieleria marina TaxID=1930275 RepID=A0A517NNK2_9BACT|nr:hypothetical protein K239x_06520 [Planctomycetes bacterium K23_9]
MLIATCTRLWQLVAGLVSVAIITQFFSLQTQDIYYVFADLLALQTLFDLGLTGVLLSLASREWPTATESEPSDATSLAKRRLGSLIRDGTRWFVVMSVLFAIGASTFGLWYLQGPETDTMQWRAPWIASVVLTAAAMIMMPCIGVLEGKYVVPINIFRLTQAIIGNLVVWLVITQGGSLWAVAASAAVRLLCESFFVFGRFRKQLFDLIRQEPLPANDALDWRSAVRPLQWRIGLQAIVAYLATRTYTLIVLDAQSTGAAGRIGLTWAILIAIQASGLAWLQARLPQIGRHVQESDFTEARRLVRQTSYLAVATIILGSIALVVLHLGLTRYYPATADRLLPLPPILLFSVSLAIYAVIIIWSTYTRLFRIDPFVRPGLIGSTVLATAAIVLGVRYGAMGIAVAHLGTMTLVNLPLLIPVIRRELAVVEKP